MFIGHFAVAFAAKRAAPRTSLGVTFVAAQLVDMLWPIFLLLGWEQVRIEPNANPFLTLDFTNYPWTHSLADGRGVGSRVRRTVFRGHEIQTRCDRRRAARAESLGARRRRSSYRICRCTRAARRESGSGCGRVQVARSSSKAFYFSPGIAAYANVTRARDRIGRFGLLGLAVFLVVLYVVSIVGPPPPSVTVLAWTALDRLAAHAVAVVGRPSPRTRQR